MTDRQPTTIKFKAAAQNTGALTINGKVVLLTHSDGRPLQAGDLKVGQAFSIDPETGVATIKT